MERSRVDRSALGSAFQRMASLVCVLAAVAASGCTVRQGDYTVISNRLARVDDFELDKTDRVRNIVGEDSRLSILMIATGGVPTLDGALDNAFSKADGDVITDAVVESWEWTIPFLLSGQGWRVRGDVVKTRR